MQIERRDVLFTDARDAGYEPEVVRDVLVIDGTITLQIDDAGGGYYDWVFREITSKHNGLIEVNMDGCKRTCLTANLGEKNVNVAAVLKMSVWDFAKHLMNDRRGAI